MKSDIEIARSTELMKIKQIAQNYGIPVDQVHHYGSYMAKVSETLIDEEKVKQSNLILVTAITPTKAGIGKTTVSIGLALGLNRIGKKAFCALREPSLGPCFGMKGGAAGGGYAQVLPMEKINLHFTGDFHAITSAHNMIAALLDNYMYQNQDNGFAMKEVLWNRVLDVNDRGLRYIVTGLGGKTNGITRESSFDITPASEIMAILCLAKDEADLRRRIENILLGFTIDNKPFTVKDLGVAGAITVLLKDAIAPNLVQTTEHTPAIVHGGPFANIAHGCNSVLATKLAMTFGEYVVTEAGFGADLGAEKFYDIKCRKAGLQPKLTVIVATAQGLKMHGGVSLDKIKEPNREGLRKGFANLDKHIENLRSFGQTVVVAFNRYANDTDEEIALARRHCEELGVGFAVNNAFPKEVPEPLSWHNWWWIPSGGILRDLCVSLTRKPTASRKNSESSHSSVWSGGSDIQHYGTQENQDGRGIGLRKVPYLHCQDSIFLLHRSETVWCGKGFRIPCARHRAECRSGNAGGHCGRDYAYARLA